MVGLNAPEEFVEVLRGFEGLAAPECVIRALEWAANNPERAKDVAERYRRLKFTGRKCFEDEVCHGLDPDKAMERAEQRQMEVSKERSILVKALAASRKGGYTFKMPNGVECTMKYKDDRYELTFKPGGAEVTFLTLGRRRLSRMLLGLMDGDPFAVLSGARFILYKGKEFPVWSNVANAVLKAIKENVAPEVIAVVDF